MVMVQRTPRDQQQSEAFIAPRDFIADTSADFLIRGFVLTDTEPRYRVRADGRVEAGPGGTTVPDVGFERLAANIMGMLAADSWRIPTDGELQFGSDVVLSRGAADRLDLAAGDTLSVRTAIQLRQATANYSLEWADPAAARTITIPDPGAAANVMMDQGAYTIAGVQTHTGRLDLSAVPIRWTAGVAVTAAQYEVVRDADATNQLHFNIPTGATFEWSVNDAAEMLLSATNLTPGANDGNALGSATVSWADVFLAAGGVINWANGEITITETDADTLTIAGVATLIDIAAGIVEVNNAVRFDTGVAIVATSYSVGRDADATNQLHFNIPTGATFEWSVNDAAEMLLSATNLTPGANDGNALGSATVSWADTFLASGAVINFASGDLTLTHSAAAMAATGAWTFSGASVTLSATTGNTLIVDTNTLVVDASNNFVGILTATPTTALSFGGTNTTIAMATADATDNGVLNVNGGGANGNNRGGSISLSGNEHASTGSVDIEAGDVVGGVINLRTAADVRVRLDRSANLGINTTTFGTGAARVLGLGNASAVQGAAAADIVQLACLDFAAGDARLSIQSELGSPVVLGNNAVRTGLAGTATGSFVMSGLTSGVVTVTVGAVAGTWTMQLPAAVGVAGEQLTDAGGNGITSWAAAGSLREYKNILGVASPQDALDQILHTQAYRFHYKEGFGTRDYKTEYVGIMADEAPWAMHYGGSIVNPVNTLGYMVLGFQAVDKRLSLLEQNGRLKQEMLALLDSDEDFRRQVREKLAVRD